MKVKIIEKECVYALENAINEWINNYSSMYEVIDIKYSGKGYSVPHGRSNVSAMIIYKYN